MTTLEKEIEAKLVATVKAHGGLCLKWVCPGFAGVPDRIVLMPGGRAAFVETKRPKGGTLRPLQAWWRDKLIAQGFPWFLVHDQDSLDNFGIFYLEEVVL